LENYLGEWGGAYVIPLLANNMVLIHKKIKEKNSCKVKLNKCLNKVDVSYYFKIHFLKVQIIEIEFMLVYGKYAPLILIALCDIMEKVIMGYLLSSLCAICKVDSYS
jgi:hypothetical protein